MGKGGNSTPPRDLYKETSDELKAKLDLAPRVFGADAIAAQRKLWALQGVQNTWFCGAYFGSGFHEDGLQAGLAVAEQLGGLRRPWRVPDESGRIELTARGGLVGAPELLR